MKMILAENVVLQVSAGSVRNITIPRGTEVYLVEKVSNSYKVEYGPLTFEVSKDSLEGK